MKLLFSKSTIIFMLKSDYYLYTNETFKFYKSNCVRYKRGVIVHYDTFVKELMVTRFIHPCNIMDICVFGFWTVVLYA